MAADRFDLTIGLVDMVSAPLRRIHGMLAGLRNPLGALRAGASAAAGAFRQLGIAGSVVAGLSFAAPIVQAGELEAKLTDIAITAGQTGGAAKAMVAELRGQYQALALQVGQSSADVTAAAQVMISGGIELPLLNRLLPAIGKAATAAGASMDDMARTGLALADNLKIAPEEMEKVFAQLAVAGKAGRFELKNMAAEFPGLTSTAAQFGLKGAEGARTLAAALQVAMKGAGTASEAANNLNNFMSATLRPTAIANFKKMGVDIVAVMGDAAKKGLNPFEAVVGKIRKLVGEGTDAEKTARLGMLFEDAQVLNFLKPMLQQTALYKDVMAQMAAADTSILDKDAETRKNTIEGQLTRLSTLSDTLVNRLGTGFSSVLSPVLALMDGLHAGIARLDQEFPGLVDGFLSVAGPVVAFVAAAAALSMVIGPLSAGFSALGIIIGIALGPAMPIIAALAALAYVVYANWDSIGPWFEALWASVMRVFKAAFKVLQALWRGDGLALRQAWDEMMQSIGDAVIPAKGLFKAIGNAISREWSAAWTALRAITINAARAILVAVGLPLARVGRIVSSLGKTFDIVGTYVGASVSAMWTIVKSFAVWLFSFLTGDMAGATAAAGEMWNGLVSLVDVSLSAIIDLVDAWTGGALTDAMNTGKAIIDQTTGALGRGIDGLKSAFTAAADGIVAAWDFVGQKIDAVLALVRSGADVVANSWLGQQLGLDDVSQTAAAMTKIGAPPGVAAGNMEAILALTRSGLGEPAAQGGDGGPGAPATAPAGPAAPVAPTARAEVKTDINVRVAAENGAQVKDVSGSNPSIPVNTGRLSEVM